MFNPNKFETSHGNPENPNSEVPFSKEATPEQTCSPTIEMLRAGLRDFVAHKEDRISSYDKDIFFTPVPMAHKETFTLEDGTVITLPPATKSLIEKESGYNISNVAETTNEKNIDTAHPANSEVNIDGERYRTDDNGQPHMKYNSETGTWELLPNIEYTVNGYTYETNEKGQIIRVYGKIHMKEHEGRKPLNDDVPNMQEGDDRGHLIADQFDGSNRLDNLVPMDMHLNRGAYKKMEDDISKAKAEGKEVDIDIEVKYDDSGRPTEFLVKVTIDGETEIHVFNNESQGGNQN